MTEEQIERRVERIFDRVDARLMKGELSQSLYNRKVRAISRWADRQYRRAIITVQVTPYITWQGPASEAHMAGRF